MIKILSICAGLTAALAASQFPSFTQQYIQRLGGQVDALTTVVKDFDNSALAAGLGREEALTQMTGTEFLSARQADMRRTFARHANLTNHLATLQAATPMQRLIMPHRIADPEVFATTWADFKPSVPLTSAGAVSGGTGAFIGWGLFAAFIAVLRKPFRKRQTQTQLRYEPQLRKPKPESETDHTVPRLLGEIR